MPREWVRGRVLALLLVALLTGSGQWGCAAEPSGSASAPASAETQNSDWSKFSTRNESVAAQSKRTVPESPIEITGVEYVRGIRLSWTESREVPTFEPDNQTLRIPSGALQAVLMITVQKVPDHAHLRVDWYYKKSLVYSDTLASTEDGEHFFALVQRESDRLVSLPAGDYRADVFNGSQLLKSVRFEVAN